MDLGVGFVDILPRATGFLDALKSEVDTQLSAVESSTADRTSALMTGISDAVIGIGAAVAAGVATSLAATVQWASQVHQLQLLTGMTAEQASSLLATAGEYGIGVDKLSSSLGILEKNVVSNSPAIAKWGVTARDAAGNLLPIDKILGNVANKFVELGGPGGVGTAFIKSLAGRGGQSLIPLLQNGAQGLQQMEEHARALGLVMSQDDVDAAYKLALAQHTLSESVKGASVSIGSAFLPVATTMVDVLATMFQWVSQLPKPFLELGLAIPMVAAAITLLWRVGSFLLEGTTKLIGAITGVGVTETAALGPTELLTAAITQLVETMGVAVPGAAAEADAAIAGFAATESGLLVPTGVAAGAMGGLEGASAGVLSTLGGFSLLALPVAAALVTIGMGMRGAAIDAAALESNTQKALAALQAGGTAAAAVRAQAATFGQPFVRTALGGRAGGAGNVEAQQYEQAQIGAHAAAQAVAEFNKQEMLASQTSVQLATSIKGAFAQITDPTAPLTPNTIDLLNASMDNLTSGLDTFTQRSGIDASKITADLSAVINNAKSTPAQVLAAEQNALASMKSLYSQWHDQIAQELSFTSSDLSKFADKTHVSVGQVDSALHKSIRQSHDFAKALLEITQVGPRGKDVAQYLLSLGPSYAGLAESIANTDKKHQRETIGLFDQSLNAGDTFATQLQKALDPVFNKMILQLKNVVRAIEGFPLIKDPTTTARQGLVTMGGLLGGIYNQILNLPPIPPQVGGRPTTATGGITTHAQTRIVGEAGHEAIINLESNQGIRTGAEWLRSAMRGMPHQDSGDLAAAIEAGVSRALQKHGGRGGRVSGTLSLDPKGTRAFIEGVIAETQDDQDRFSSVVAGMRG